MMAVQNPIKNRQEDVIASFESPMMQHVMLPREPHPTRQPSAQVKAPMDLFIKNVVGRESQEHSCAYPVAQQALDREYRRRIQKKDEYHHCW
jgi:hypothetical protein